MSRFVESGEHALFEDTMLTDPKSELNTSTASATSRPVPGTLYRRLSVLPLVAMKLATERRTFESAIIVTLDSAPEVLYIDASIALRLASVIAPVMV